MNIIVELKTDGGQLIGLMTVPPKDFKTGSKGYFTSGKVEVHETLSSPGAAGGDWQQICGKDRGIAGSFL